MFGKILLPQNYKKLEIVLQRGPSFSEFLVWKPPNKELLKPPPSRARGKGLKKGFLP